MHRLSKNKVFDNQIIILTMIIEEGRAKDGKIIDKEGIKDGKIIEGINKIKMVNPIKMGIIEMVIIKIMDIGKEEI